MENLSCPVKTSLFALTNGFAVGAIVGISEVLLKSKGIDPNVVSNVGNIASASIAFVSALLIRSFLYQKNASLLASLKLSESENKEVVKSEINCNHRLITIGEILSTASISAFVACVFATTIGLYFS